MEPILIIKLIIFIGFIFLSAFFSSAETAFTAVNRIKLRSLNEENVKGAEKLEKMLENPRNLITGILIGNNISNIGASAMATAFLMETFNSLGFTNFAANMAIITGIMTFILLTFGEITPKTIAIKNPAKYALRIASIIHISIILFYPFIKLFTLISMGISKILGISSEVSKIITAAEVKAIINMGEEEGILDPEEKHMIEGVFKVSEKIIREVMTPRTDTTCIDISSSINDAIDLFIEKGHSRIPVYEEKIDNIQGVLYAKDLLAVERSSAAGIRDFIRDAKFMPETKNIESLLQDMKESKFHIAIVVDEHGGMSGLVTMEDIIEEIVGEIIDEHDVEEKHIKITGQNKYQIDASINMDDLSEHLDIKFPEDDDDYDTLGGFILNLVGEFPNKGTEVSYENLTFTVLEIKKRRIISIECIVQEDINKDIENLTSN
ncbi:hemolysin [Candidatus Marinamargulisbacteria bacterium SCGC AAA071-K20]|nr:hemolysin [Candidatus Marinamargulisbacteria bacterium SCGC AAA071-K20]